MSELTDWCRKEAARNARMQGDKEHQTNQRRKTFRYRNHMLVAVADRIEELEKALNQVDHQIVHLMDGNPDMVDYDVIAESEHRLYGDNG
jgi:hypothetical protein